MPEVVKTVSVYGSPEGWSPLTKNQWHGTTYWEWEIPEKLEKKLTKMVKAELKKFYKNCKCENCSTDRLAKKLKLKK